MTFLCMQLTKDFMPILPTILNHTQRNSSRLVERSYHKHTKVIFSRNWWLFWIFKPKFMHVLLHSNQVNSSTTFALLGFVSNIVAAFSQKKMHIRKWVTGNANFVLTFGDICNCHSKGTNYDVISDCTHVIGTQSTRLAELMLLSRTLKSLQ